jgi:hypothetical protein
MYPELSLIFRADMSQHHFELVIKTKLQNDDRIGENTVMA